MWNRCSSESKPTAQHMLARVSAAMIGLLAGCVAGPAGMATARAANPDLGKAPPWSAEEANARSDLDPAVPVPQTVIGHAVGDGAVRYESLIRYLTALADASPLVTMTPYAQSHEGRTLYYLTITSAANHARLDQIKADNAKLLDPRKLASPAEGERLVDSLPGVAWLAYSIHGDELSSTDAALELAYLLTAGTDDVTRQLRDKLVIHIDPVMNPDGRERYLSQIQPLQGKIENPDHQAMQHTGLWYAGRGNHYFFDMNRDWALQVHPETRGRTARIVEWNPHLVVDSHEMGSLDTYLFEPPREPFNVNLSENMLEWRRRFSADQAKAFDAHGWSYYTREWYEAWYPGYTDLWASFHGAVGILYEQAGVNAAQVKQPAGNILSYRDAIHHHVVSSLANLGSLRANRRQILQDYLAEHRWAVDPAQSGREVFLVPPVADAQRLSRLADVLTRQGIEVGFAADAFDASRVTDVFGGTAEARTFPPGSLLIRAAQPRRRLVLALLEFDPRMTDTYLQEERKDLENRRGSRAYDVSAWNLAMAHGLAAYWASEITTDVKTRDAAPSSPERASAPPAYGYLIDGASTDIHAAAIRLLASGLKVRVAMEAFSLHARDFVPGTLLIRNHENPDATPALVNDALPSLNVEVVAANTALAEKGPDLGGQKFGLLVEPRVAVAMEWPVSSTGFGSTWWLLDDQLGLRMSPFNIQALGFFDLRKYNVIVLPDVWGAPVLEAVLNDGVRQKLKQWVQAGGTLIAVGDSAAFLANESRGLSEVRLRRDVLDKLDVYQEAVARERAARQIFVDAAALWNPPAPPADDELTVAPNKRDHPGVEADGKSPKELDARKRDDEWKRIFSPNGTFVAATFDPEHWLAFGLQTGGLTEHRLPVLVNGATALMSRHPVQTPIRLDAARTLRVSGLLWPEAAERLSDTAFATVERVGYGQIILFRDNPIFRGYTFGVARAYLNAIVFGPGLGTQPEVPW